MTDDEPPKARESKSKMTDDDWLRLVASERQASIGFDQDADLTDAREASLNYYKGEMPDVKSMPNRSKAVSTDVADAIETVLPDVIEIFTGGDDVAAFIPTREDDEDAAQQETDYVNHVLYNENPGFLTLYSAFKDALLVKTGIIKFWWEEEETEEEFKGKTHGELALAAMAGAEISEVTEAGNDPQLGPLFDFTIKRKSGRVRIEAVPPEDFTVARDTKVDLQRATYAGMRSRQRVQDLIATGLNADIIRSLPGYAEINSSTEQSRDTVSESSQSRNNAVDDMRRVEVVEHFIRYANPDEEDAKPCLWRVLTGGTETVFIEAEEVEQIPFAAFTPYLTPHRFYGESVADKLIEVQKIRTALTRMWLDSGYFAMNQRLTVDMGKADATTIADILRNEPGVPIRTKGPGAVEAVQAGALGFDVLSGLEYAATMGETRTGIVRNAQGLNPNTLHDTAKGALALMTAAQKRIRLIARIFAETGMKPLLLGVHALIRTHGTAAAKVRLRGKWQDVDPTQWGERNDLEISIGLGASGKEHELQVMATILEQQKEIVLQQGGLTGPLVTGVNAYNALKRFAEKGGLKAPELFFSDPERAEPQPPRPDPKMAEVQGKLQISQQGQQMDARNKQMQMQHDVQSAGLQAQLDAMKQQHDHEAKLAQITSDAQLKQWQTEQELALKREQIAEELQMKREDMAARLILHEKATNATIQSKVTPGGEPG